LKNIESILNRGFSLASNVKHGQAHGSGIYFSNDLEFTFKYGYNSYNNRYASRHNISNETPIDLNKIYVIVCDVYVNNKIVGKQNCGILPLLPNSTDKYYDTAVDRLQETNQFIKKDPKEGINILGVYEVTLKDEYKSKVRKNRYQNISSINSSNNLNNQNVPPTNKSIIKTSKNKTICNNCKGKDIDYNKLLKDPNITPSIRRQYLMMQRRQIHRKSSSNICVCDELKKINISGSLKDLKNPEVKLKTIQFINHVNKDIEIFYKPKDFNIYTNHINKCKKMTISGSLKENGILNIQTQDGDEFIIGYFSNNEFLIIRIITIDINKDSIIIKM